jgi:metal-responsive CopG/Arc/MetJ family transcriptional regulator
MSTTIAISMAPEELSELDDLRRRQGISRAEAVREALRWYARWADVLPPEDPITDEIEP